MHARLVIWAVIRIKYSTTRIKYKLLILFFLEAKEQVTANLANFSYDPINYKFLRKNEIINLFLELLSSPNNVLALNGISGICNLCLGKPTSETKLNKCSFIFFKF